MNELEQALEQRIAAAKAELDSAEGRAATYQRQADELIAKARRQRTELLQQRDAVARDAKEEYARLVKMRKVLRGEPLQHKAARTPNGEVSEGQVAEVREAILAITADDPDAEITVSDIHKNRLEPPKMDYNKVRLAMDVLRQEEFIRKAGQGKRGANEVQLYKLLHNKGEVS